jgi:hypothetical protein
MQKQKPLGGQAPRHAILYKVRQRQPTVREIVRKQTTVRDKVKRERITTCSDMVRLCDSQGYSQETDNSQG